VTADLLAAATKLRVIGRAGTGVDNIDLQAATRRGVVVMNAPGGNSVSVAEHTVALLLALARQVADASQSTRGGKWEKKKFAAGRELLGKTLGVVGTGNIGALVVQRAKAFGMKVIAYDPFLSEDAAAKLGVELVQLRRSSAAATRSRARAAQRADQEHGGGAADRADEARRAPDQLRAGRPGGREGPGFGAEGKEAGRAALDVFETEPPPADHPLFSCENFIATRTWAAARKTRSRTWP